MKPDEILLISAMIGLFIFAGCYWGIYSQLTEIRKLNEFQAKYLQELAKEKKQAKQLEAV